MTAGPMATYAAIYREVDRIVSAHAANDREQAAYMVARSALLIVRADKGSEAAAAKAYQLADELAVTP